MKRTVVLGALVVVGGLSIGVSAAWQGQQARTIQVDKLSDRLFVFRGGGGNTAVFLTADGAVVVDAKNPGWGQPILDKIKELTPKPVTLLINTHTHGDHVGGNVEFPASVDIVVQANTKANMQKMSNFAQSANGMAKRTFTDRMTIGKGPDQIDLYYFGPGHTNGDAWVVFPALRAMHSGDIFANKGLTGIDASNGGSVLYVGSSLQKAHDGIKGVDTIINGHTMTQTTWADLKMAADLNQDFVTWAQAELKAGKTPEAAAPGWVTPQKYIDAGFSAAAPTMFGGVVGRLQRLQEEMAKK